ncbi:hypothetical protein B0H12DRAFT_1173523 [Mycena haematopus]|nr:hypothetical protein B0H12DRAFT_1173523 [Mycena haematopus]
MKTSPVALEDIIVGGLSIVFHTWVCWGARKPKFDQMLVEIQNGSDRTPALSPKRG